MPVKLISTETTKKKKPIGKTVLLDSSIVEPNSQPKATTFNKTPTGTLKKVLDIGQGPNMPAAPNYALNKKRPAPAPEPQVGFYDKAEAIRAETEATLKKIYGNNVKVNITQKQRTPAQQAAFVKSGASHTKVSNHNLGEAADYQITINGKVQAGNTKESLDPYLYLGGAAKNHGMFWGWQDDSGHVGSTEYAWQTIQNKPELAQSPDIKAFYEANNKTTTTRYKPLMETLDKIYNVKSSRTYTGGEIKKGPMLQPKYYGK